MRDNMKPCHHTVCEDVVYKEVVVIGNGPSGMVTSYMLAGNVPYLKKLPDDLPIDDMLRTRLSNLPPGQSLYEADLIELAEGLEGRSQNPVSLLMDNLWRPCTDFGIEADPLIEWKYDVEKQIEHIVLGRGPPGGAWHTFPPSVQTLSPAAWVSLPPDAPPAPPARLAARQLAHYCRLYTRRHQLQRYFRDDVIVTSVTLCPRSSVACAAPSCPYNASFCVSGYDKRENAGFRYLCARVVLACGGNDRPNRLPKRIQHALYSLADIEKAAKAVAALPVRERGPVLVVGSGVSAADACVLARRAGLPAAHLHRDPAPSLAALSHPLYADYVQIYKMMCEGPSEDEKNYIPYPEHIILEVNQEKNQLPTNADQKLDDAIRLKRVKLLNVVTNEVVEITVSIIAVLIGSKPDLFFLQTNFNLDSIEKPCTKCTEKTKIDDNQKQCFLRNHWHYLKSVVQSCKSRLSTEINGNTETQNCNDTGHLEEKIECKCKVIPYSNRIKRKNCQCSDENPYSSGIGFGLDPKKPVDCRANPIAIDKSTHEVLNGPKGMYALGPLTGDNFIRFIPGGALAIVSHIHRDRKRNNSDLP